MTFNVRLFHSGVSGMKDLFDKKVENHRKSQLDNPFSQWGGRSQARRLSKEDQFYGRPLPGSQTEKRAQIAQHHVMMDIKYICDMIWDCGEWKSTDGRAAITFRKIFNLYNTISDKLVGTLLRARKHGFVYFEGEMLYQRRDDDKVIELSRNINTIRKRFGTAPVSTGGGEAEPWTYGDSPSRGIVRRQSSPSITISTSSKHANQDLQLLQARRNSLPIKNIRQHLFLSTNFNSLEEEEEEDDLPILEGSSSNCEAYVYSTSKSSTSTDQINVQNPSRNHGQTTLLFTNSNMEENLPTTVSVSTARDRESFPREEVTDLHGQTEVELELYD